MEKYRVKIKKVEFKFTLVYWSREWRFLLEKVSIEH